MRQLPSVLNFRDVLMDKSIPAPSRTTRITKKKLIQYKPGILYRSARLDNISQVDLQVLIKECRVQTIIDLRRQ